MTPQSWIRKRMTRPITHPVRRGRPRVRLDLITLEDRWVPATFTVINTNDSGPGSFRDAVDQANANAGIDTVDFDTAGVFAFAQTLFLTTGPITLTDTATTTITGPGVDLVSVNGSNLSRVFQIDPGASADLSGLTIAGGNAVEGGGIWNRGTMNLILATVSGNTATGGFGGGGILNEGTTTISDTTIRGNTAANLGGGGFSNAYSGVASLNNVTVSGNLSGSGGGIVNDGGNLGGPGLSLTVTNSTITNNTATQFGGGGLYAIRGGTVTLVNSTISGNTSTSANASYGTGGVVHAFGSTVSLANTIVAGNTGLRSDIAGSFTSLGNNLIGSTDDSSGWVGSDMTGTLATPLDARLGPLADNGGPTQTIALLPNSPAVDAGNPANAPANDQRGQVRFGNTDIGASEYRLKVTGTADGGLGSLRQAVLDANATVGVATIVLGRFFDTAQTISLTAGTLTLSNAAGTTLSGPTADVTINGNALSLFSPLTINVGNRLRIDSSIGGITSLTSSGSGTVTLTGINSYNNTFVNSGTLVFQRMTGFGATVVAPGATLNAQVTNATDFGFGSLRQSLQSLLIASGTGNLALSFAIPGTGVQTISPTSALPPLTKRVVIDGTTQPGFAGSPMIRIDGSLAGNVDGFKLQSGANGSTVAGLIVSNFAKSGILLSGSNNNTIRGNWIGTDSTGTAAAGNETGITLTAFAGNNTIGGPTAADRNVISGNTNIGVSLTGYATTNNRVAGNYIGTTTDGLSRLGNGHRGVSVTDDAYGNVIGTNGDGVNDATEGNVISGNGGTNFRDSNVFIENTHNTFGGSFPGTVVAGNVIGLDKNALASLAPAGASTGVFIDSNATYTINNRIGTDGNGVSDALERNIISGHKRDGVGNGGDGVYLRGQTSTGGIVNDNVIAGNWIGLDGTGNAAVGNEGAGIRLASQAVNNRIGTDANGSAGDEAEGNVIAGNFEDGINTYSVSRIAGNRIGTNASGTTAIPNLRDGIRVLGTGNTIGGTSAVSGNLISGNVSVGVSLAAGTSGNEIRGNRIGTDVSGTSAIPNAIGIDIRGGLHDVGGTAAGAGNVISGNSLAGIRVSEIFGVFLAIEGNYIGTDASGLAAVGNGIGILLDNGAANITIGGAAGGAGNLISGNATGVVITDAGTNGNWILGNFIGTDKTGTTAVGNVTDGISIRNGATGNHVGDGTLEGRNVIGGNAIGIAIHGIGTTDNAVQNNFVGTNAAGTGAVPNGTGISVHNATTFNTIGGFAVGEGNLISGNSGDGIVVSGFGTSGNFIYGNHVGLDATGLAALGNGNSGIRVSTGATGNVLGGTAPGAGNTVSGNALAGVEIAGSQNVVQGNRIGTDPAGTLALGNNQYGVLLTAGASSNLIGGNSSAAGNVIGGNVVAGVFLTGSGTSANTVAGNRIGIDAGGKYPLANGDGVRISTNASSNMIGGTASGAANVIAYNAFNGLTLLGTAAADNTARRNSFFANGGLAIDIGNDGATLNTPGTDLNAPVFRIVRTGVGVIEVEGYARPGKTLEFYAADNSGEGKTFLGTGVEGSPADTDAGAGTYGPGPVNGQFVGTDTSSRFRFTFAAPANFAPGEFVTAVAIGSVSEFAAPAKADVSAAFGAPVVDAGPDATLLVGQSFNGRGAFSDIDSDYWPSAEVNYGDGSGWQALTLDPPTYAAENGDDFTTAATVGFAMNHIYATPGQFVVSVRVTDDSGAVGTDSLWVSIVNSPPVIDNSRFVVTPQRLAEGGMVSVGGAFTDPGLADTHTVRIVWGDGSDSFATVNPLDRTFTAQHIYLDDNQLNTASDVYPLQVIVTDNFNATATSVSGLFFVQVDNVRPSGLTISTNQSAIHEGDTVYLDGSFLDPGVLDTHRVAVDWGDGSPETIVTLAAGVTSFNDIAHSYGNNPVGPATDYTIRVRVVDDDEPLTPIGAETTISVANVVPSFVLLVPSANVIFENDTISLDGSFTDLGTNDKHRVIIDWGDGSVSNVLSLSAGVTTFSGITHRYRNNPAVSPIGSYTITVTVSDSDEPGTVATGAAFVAVANVAPSVTSLTQSATTILENEFVEIAGTYADVGPLDRHTVTINWGDGTTSAASVNSTTRTFTARHQYRDDPAGLLSNYAITATVLDNDGGSDFASRTLTVTNVAPTLRILTGPNNSATNVHLVADVTDPSPLDTFVYSWTATPTGGGPAVTGTGPQFPFASSANSSYSVSLTVTDDDGGTVSSSMHLVVLTDVADTYAPASVPPGVTSLMIMGLGGDDVIDLSALSIPVTIDGGAGTDTLTGGSADDIIFLHQGNDRGFGLGGNDQYLLTPNSTLTVVDGLGNNTLDFGRSDFGVTFDLSQSAGQVQDVLPLTPNLHFVSANDLGTGRFGTLAGSTFDDALTAASNSSIYGGLGRDRFFVNGNTVGTLISGGADADELTTDGVGITNIDFRGDDGADVLTNLGTVAAITFGGGSDADELLNLGTIAQIDFRGDDGADSLLNEGTIATITFMGGSDGDLLQNTGTVATMIDFRGDDGADVLTNLGIVATITFTGGADGDLLQTSSGSVVDMIDFSGDDGADVLTNLGTVATITFTGGSDGDLLQNTGSVATMIDFRGDDGADVLTNLGSVATITFTGGADGDLLQTSSGSMVDVIDFRGDDGADILTNLGSVATITFTGGADGDLLQTSSGSVVDMIDFRGDDGADVLTNLGSVTTITFTGGSDGDLLQNTGPVATMIDFRGDDGADSLLNGGTVEFITFAGGSDGDLLQNEGTVAIGIDFQGDDGADILTNLGTVASITFTGGADGDLLQTSSGSSAEWIDFRGDDGADTLTNFGSVATITFTGGADDDRFRNYVDSVGLLSFGGDDGADLFVNTGNGIDLIEFFGADGADILLNTGNNVAYLDFYGDDGADILQNAGSVSIMTFAGGSDGDKLLNNGTGIASIDFSGDDGADVLTNFGSVETITFWGGADGDLLQTSTGSSATLIDFTGDDGADTLTSFGTIAEILFSGGADGDLLQNAGTVAVSIDFHGDDGADTLTNIGSVATITFTGGSDGDLLQNTGTVATMIDFRGDDGADTLTNLGDVDVITFTGGSDADLLQNAGTVAGTIDFRGDDGADTLTNVGIVATITFTGGADGDLLQTSTGSAATVIDFTGDDGADTLLNFGTAEVITFAGGADADYLQNGGNVATLIDFTGDDGADVLINLSGTIAAMTFAGGADNDVFWNAGTGLVSATFFGDDGADVFTNLGTVATITFAGGADGDWLHNTGMVATAIDFTGDDGADILTNAGSVSTITFTGGADGDLLQTTAGGTAVLIDFRGDDGADNLINNGGVTTITFAGGADGDLLQNAGTIASMIDFRGDDGADTLINTGTGQNGSAIHFTAGAGDDLYIERGQASSISFNGGIGHDRILFAGSGSATFDGGEGPDDYLFVGSAKGAVTIDDNNGAADANTLDFSGYTAGGVNVNLSQTATQTIASGLTLTLTSATGIRNIVGTSYTDTLIGNALDNVLTGASIGTGVVTTSAVWNGVTQWVYLDFDDATEAGEHQYSEAERNEIQSRIAADYQGPDAQNPWFHVQFTQNENDIPTGLRQSGQYATLSFNRTPSFNRPGGEASELDFRNTNLGGTASIQVNGLTGGANQPARTSENVVALSVKIAAHELAHLMGVRHADAFGPIGYGLHSPPGIGSFKPYFYGPVGAFETFSHLIGSPATVGSDRFNDLNDLYFGEREAIKLSFAERGSVAAEQSGMHGSRATAQPLTLAALAVPNTSRGVNAGSTFDVAALAVTGQIGLAGPRSESDFYSFTGRRGDRFHIEVLSVGLAGPGPTIDSVLRLYDSQGHLVPYYGGVAVNDDQFEPTDSLLYDIVLPEDGTYFIEVDTFTRDPGDPVFDPSGETSLLNPMNTDSPFHPLNQYYDPARLARFLDTRDDTDTGRYELFVYRFGASNAADSGDILHGGDGNDTIRGGMGGDDLNGGRGDDLLDPGDGTAPVPTPVGPSVSEGQGVVVPVAVGPTQSVTWRVTGPNGQAIAQGNGSNMAFVPTDNGTFTVTYTVTGSEGDSFTDSTDVTALNVAPTVTAGGNITLSTPTLTRSGNFTDPGTDTWTATVNYGDGTGDQPLGLNANRTFTLNHNYGTAGPFTVTVTVFDGTDSGTATFEVTSSVTTSVEAGPNRSADEGSLVSLAGAGFVNTQAVGTHTATINWGDGTPTVAGSVTQTPLGNGASGTISGSHRYADNGSYVVTVTVVTPLGTTHSDTFTVTVNNVAPTLAALNGPTTVIPGQPLTYASSFLDPGFHNALNVGGEVSEAFTGTIHWGDGSTTEVPLVSWATGSPGVTTAGSASSSHTYAAAGLYTITLTVHDDDGGSASRTLTVSVTESAYVLATTGSEVLSVTGNGRVVLPGVIEVASNSPTAIRASGNAQISASRIHVVGGYGLTGNATIGTTPVTGGSAAADPLAALAAPAASGSVTSVNVTGNSTVTIGPGTYGQIKVSGNGKLTLLPGVYVVLGGGVSITGNATVTGNGVSIYNAGSNGTYGGIAVTGNGAVSLTPPAAGQPYAGILFFQSRDNTRALAISGNGLLGIRGTIYAPAAQLALSGNAELKASLVVRSVTVSGNASSTLMNQGDLGVQDLADTLLAADLWVYVDNADGAFAPAALRRIDAAIAGMNALLGGHHVSVSLVSSPDIANVVLDAGPGTPVGGMAEGVLGYFDETAGRGLITLVQGWRWYDGEDPSMIDADEFDFQTIVTHELGHALGLGHSIDSLSVMHDELNTGAVRRTLAEDDLNIPEHDGGGGDPLMAFGRIASAVADTPPHAITPRGAKIHEWYLAPPLPTPPAHDTPTGESIPNGTVLIPDRRDGRDPGRRNDPKAERTGAPDAARFRDAAAEGSDTLEPDVFHGTWLGDSSAPFRE